MEVISGPVSIATILRDRNNWRRYLAWKGDELDEWTGRVVARTLACRTLALGCHMYDCDDCDIVRLIPHSCKTAFCSSCGVARTDAWCRELLSDLLDVEYRHLVFCAAARAQAPDPCQQEGGPERPVSRGGARCSR